MRIAVIGSGVSGLVAAHLLRPQHEVVVFEAAHQLGGHTHTVDVAVDGQAWAVDCGFIVYNEQNYPLFSRLLDQLAVATQTTSMSFSVRMQQPNLEYNGSSLRQLFVQRRNVFRPSFHGMLLDVLRFNRTAATAVRRHAGATIAEFVQVERYSEQFTRQYLVPMSAALWSAPRESVLEMPAAFLVNFFDNHGMLQVEGRPQWRVVAGGSREYVRALTRPFADRIRLNCRVRTVVREPDLVRVDGEPFDHCILACHSDQALSLLADATDTERAVLGSIPYQENTIVLHTDRRTLPRRRRAWAAWNYHTRGGSDARVGVTYNMNILQNLDAPVTFCVTLNEEEEIAPDRVLYRTVFDHPVFSVEGCAAQKRHAEISGVDRTHFCGAYWGNGFHEDGVRSAVQVAKRFGVSL